MASGIYLRGELRMITHTAAAAVTVDDIVPIDNNLAVARANADSGEHVQAAIGGVFRMPKAAGVAIMAGERVSWVAASEEISNNGITPAAGDVVGCGVAVADAAGGDATADVDLTPSAGVRT